MSILKFRDGNPNFLSTSHSETGEYGGLSIFLDPVIKADPSKLVEFTHSHPDGITYPSGRGDRSSDIAVANVMETFAPNVNSNIFTPAMAFIYLLIVKQCNRFRSRDNNT